MIMTEKEKSAGWFRRSHLFYLLVAIGLYLVKMVLYFAIADIPVEVHQFHMAIDDMIPFCKYFYPFYFAYYFVPEILLWLLSFRDKRKYWTLVSSYVAANIICCVCFLIYQVQMIRPAGYPMDLSLGDVRSVSDLFDYFISFQYNADSTALNCFPSLHCTMGCLEVLLGLKLFGWEKRIPVAMSVVSVVMGVGCILSTMFIKQHYAIDALAGVVLMIAVYIITDAVFRKVLKAKNGTEG